MSYHYTTNCRWYAAFLFLALAVPLWGESDEEAEERLLEAIDRLEAEGWVDPTDLQLLREAASFHRSNCSLLDAWLDEPACPDESSPKERKKPASKEARGWHSERYKAGVQSGLHADLSLLMEQQWPSLYWGEASLHWRGSPDGALWRERGVAWKNHRWHGQVGQFRWVGPMGRAAPLRQKSATEESFLNPGGTIADGVAASWSPAAVPFSVGGLWWGDRYLQSEGGEEQAQLWELQLEGNRFRPGSRQTERWWVAGGVERGKSDCEVYWRPEGWIGWQSRTARLWSSWSPYNGGATDDGRRLERGTLWHALAASATVTTDRHRLELVAAGERWGSSYWRLTGGNSTVSDGYRIRTGPFLSLGSHSSFVGEKWRGDMRWSAWQSDTTVRWKNSNHLLRKSGRWNRGVASSLSGSNQRGYHWLKGEMSRELATDWEARLRAGIAWRSEVTALDELATELWKATSSYEWPVEISWKNPHFGWRLYWRDLYGKQERAIFEHTFSHNSGLNRGELLRRSTVRWRVRIPLEQPLAEAMLRLDVMLQFGGK